MIDKNKLKDIPEKPGVYLMKDNQDNIIYVGKARNLKNRVKQYFQISDKTIKVATMVEHISDFEVIVTHTEVEALILECNLIKKNMPRYNIMLKDDKSYPYIKVTTNEKYPRVIMTRQIKKDGAKYFGPFTNVNSVKQTLDLINKLYSIKRCNKNFNGNKRERPCLNYHINRCLGVCLGDVSITKYNEYIQEIINILNGKHDKVILRLKEEMETASKDQEYERAAQLRDQINGITHITEKQKMISSAMEDQDVVAFFGEDKEYCIQVFLIRKGKLLGREHFCFSEIDNERDFHTQFIKQFYNNEKFIPKEILIQAQIEDCEVIEDWLSDRKGSKVNIRVPQKGIKKKLLDMVKDNAKIALEEHKNKIAVHDEKQRKAYKWLMDSLKLTYMPTRIEAYDISNIKGTDNVGTMVVFEDLKANKKAYRRFKIKSIVGQNDYGSMQEIVFRRIERGVKELHEGKNSKFLPFPQLILLDGGIGHINAIKEIMSHYPQLNIPICGLVKDDRHRLREIVYEGKCIEIPPSTPVYYLLNNISEEVHRFAISYHKKIRSDNLLSSELSNIQGIGDAKKKELLKKFKGIDNIKKATKEELLQVKGISDKIAINIMEYFT
ncbi:excinuclease ABC subunit UvrC [Alkalibaculum sp. M08DMB]|uniref:UvrABC system protein C n=1 Tax=Alkalibaculum sporogenes TaxID=2655001 RepID=A0A6A7KC18_9FIRM|nr:excinuclease ABC subunit UvrC [Alkalibaculum sporogenes]MPW26563.1 excinuclease ABC subunit UvrC [Alkalibaculum sporogenes]